MPQNSRTLGFYIETCGPAAAFLAWTVLAFFFRDWFVSKVEAGEIVLSGLFSAVFGWAAIQTGFVFSVFGFITTKTDGFVARLRETPAMTRFDSYIKRAMYVGFFLTVYCIPLMILNLSLKNDYLYWIVAIWFGSFVWAFTSFLRVALNFGKIVSIRDDSFIPG